MKIISGGQTGVDRAALDAALAMGLECGGWCPEGRSAEDGVIPLRYPVRELPGAGYSKRTKQNAVDSDGTLVIYFGYLRTGTEFTVLKLIQAHKPYLLIDATEISAERAAQRLRMFLDENNIDVLNVAGPRGSQQPQGYDYTHRLLVSALSKGSH